MTWVRIEEDAPLHKKFFRTGVAAYGWFDAALCYCNRYLTDGFIPARDAELVFPGTPPDLIQASVEALVREHVLHVVKAGERPTCHNKSSQCPTPKRQEDGWSVHDFFVYQPSKKQVVAKSRENSLKGRKGAETRWKNDSQQPSRGHGGEHAAADGPIRSVPIRKNLRDSVSVDPHEPRRLVDEHARLFEQKIGSKFIVSYPRDCKRVKPIIDAHGIEKALDLARQFFVSDTGWWVRKNAWHLGAFVSAVNDLVSVKSNGNSSTAAGRPLFPRRMAEDEPARKEGS